MTAQGTYIPGAVDSGGGRGHRKRRHLKVSYLFFAAIAALIATRLDSDSLHLYSTGAMGLLALKMFGALFTAPPRRAGRNWSTWSSAGSPRSSRSTTRTR
ncbi:Hyaluronan synthase OS=Streptomyces griseomycini OX=66895 GN=FHS37_002699 PE=4 SV=1 [Streptomyces griseomycini]